MIMQLDGVIRREMSKIESGWPALSTTDLELSMLIVKAAYGYKRDLTEASCKFEMTTPAEQTRPIFDLASRILGRLQMAPHL